MKKIIVLLVIFTLCLISFRGLGQGLDEARMQRDIEVVEAILNELFKNKNINGFTSFPSRKTKQSTGVYVEGYGVIFKVPSTKSSNTNIVTVDGKRIIGTSSQGIGKIKGRLKGRRIQKSQNNGTTFYYVITDEDEDIEVDDEIDIEKWEKAVENAQKEKLGEMKKTIEQFFISYADLIGQLKPSDKVMLVYQPQKNNSFAFAYGVSGTVAYNGSNNEKKQSVNLTAEITKSDLMNFKSGKSSEDAFIKKIVFSEEKEKNEENNLEYEVLEGVFKRLFEKDDNGFNFGGKRIHYNRLNNFGVIYSISVNRFQYRVLAPSVSEITINNGKIASVKPEKKQEEDIKRKQKKLIQETKEYMVQYGRTLRSLKDTEVLMLDMVFNDRDWLLAKNMKLTITKAILNDYDKGSISFEDAVAKVKVKEY